MSTLHLEHQHKSFEAPLLDRTFALLRKVGDNAINAVSHPEACLTARSLSRDEYTRQTGLKALESVPLFHQEVVRQLERRDAKVA